MRHRRHFESASASREVARTEILIAELGLITQILTANIAAEEEQAGVSDRTRPEYPLHARELFARRDNLQGTIAALEQPLGGQK